MPGISGQQLASILLCWGHVQYAPQAVQSAIESVLAASERHASLASLDAPSAAVRPADEPREAMHRQ